MNSLAIFLPLVILLSLGYRFYGTRICRLFDIDDRNPTPAHTKNDGLDYVPAKNWFVLFGHHFSSIAGAGPIVGPILAVSLWGWGPAVIWIAAGSIFMGAVHDLSSLMVSVREGGSSIAEVSRGVISERARFLFLIFVWIALVIVITVFASICADTFIAEPRIVVTSLGIIPLALIVGLLIYRFQVSFLASTLFGIIGIGALILLGQRFPLALRPENARNIWMAVLFIYAFFASVIPVNILLQPRDYLCSFLLFTGLFFGSIGIIVTRPTMVAPAFISFESSQGPAFPMLFVIIACGALSGFHSIVASGTTSKQLPRESAAKKVAFGGMLLEGVLAAIAVITVGITVSKQAPVEVFSQGFGQITAPFLGRYGSFLAALILNAFILTTLDTATRINRYITEELLPLKNHLLSTVLVLSVSGYLAFSGGWKTLWKMFGISNQLVGALALIVVSVWLMSKKKNCLFAIIPAIFMLTVTLSALVLSLIKFIDTGSTGLAVVSLLLLVLGLFLTIEGLRALIRKRRPKIEVLL
ncbi:carbon starvation protein A [Candidatus Omnitrophota bacterium]